MNICVYGASSTKLCDDFISEGEKLGEAMGNHGFGLVFGGGANGMMGAAARGVHKAGRTDIIGVAPSFFNVDGILYEHCTEFIYPDNMRDRKKKMEELSDAFIITPGGIGTMDEFFEILTLKQLGRHNKPIAIFNINGFYNSLQSYFVRSLEENIIRKDCDKLVFVSDNCEEILNYIENYKPESFSAEKLKPIH